MTYLATAVARADDGWTGRELDLDDYADLDAVVDTLRDLSTNGEPVLLLVEEDDEWFGVVRVDDADAGEPDTRVFLSDARVLDQSDIASLLFQDAPSALPDDEGDEESSLRAEGDPVGDSGLLADLGTSAEDLVRLCLEKGLLPGDVLSTISERAGCLDVLEELRGG